ncbi:unnamed protein product [marine sediment metagenome]|uniref:Uncharacterized protein n=1 Tax=marine sediment metagenome TaxID=412755 RepID=X0Z291_9ZZZZ
MGGIGMNLRIEISKDYSNEANMRSQRDAVEALAAEKGFSFHWTVSE